MPGPESKPGLIEQFANISRNVEVVIAGIALYLGNFGVAALSAIGAILDHKIAQHFQSKRLKSS